MVVKLINNGEYCRTEFIRPQNGPISAPPDLCLRDLCLTLTVPILDTTLKQTSSL